MNLLPKKEKENNLRQKKTSYNAPIYQFNKYSVDLQLTNKQKYWSSKFSRNLTMFQHTILGKKMRSNRILNKFIID
jgi:hypothetical protein